MADGTKMALSSSEEIKLPKGKRLTWGNFYPVESQIPEIADGKMLVRMEYSTTWGIYSLLLWAALLLLDLYLSFKLACKVWKYLEDERYRKWQDEESHCVEDFEK